MLGDNRYGEMDSLLNCEPSWRYSLGGKIVVIKGLRF